MELWFFITFILCISDVHFVFSGTAGHGSLLHKNTVGQKLHYVLNKLMEFRQHEVDRLESDSSLSIGDVTTINLTSINGGVQSNVVPPTLEAVFDMRLALNVDHDAYEKQVRAIVMLLPLTMGAYIHIYINITFLLYLCTSIQLQQWCEEAGGGVEIVYEQKQPKVEATKIDSAQ